MSKLLTDFSSSCAQAEDGSRFPEDPEEQGSDE